MSDVTKPNIEIYVVEGMEYGIKTPIPFPIMELAFKSFMKEDMLETGRIIFEGAKFDADERISPANGMLYLSVCQSCIKYMNIYKSELKKKSVSTTSKPLPKKEAKKVV